MNELEHIFIKVTKYAVKNDINLWLGNTLYHTVRLRFK